MRILYDGYIFDLQKTGGINRYFEEIVSRLPVEAQPVLYGARRCVGLPRAARCGPPPFAGLLSPLLGAWSGTFDLAHPTFYRLQKPFDWKSIRCPVVLTVHDFTFERFGHLYPKSSQHLLDHAAAIRRADRIICVSEATRNDLFKFFPGCRAPVDVIPHGPSLLGCKPGFDSAPRQRPFFLYVGSRVFYKNFPLAVEAMAELNRHGSVADFVIAGPPLSAAERAMIARLLDPQCVESVGFPDDSTLADLYRRAIALVYPSMHEGFGLPALEAMALGTPVVALRTSSLPEVVGEAGVLLPSEGADAKNLAAALATLVQSPEKRRRLSAAAIARAAHFDWDRSAKATWGVYQAVSG